MFLAGFEAEIIAGKQLQTYTLDCEATETGTYSVALSKSYLLCTWNLILIQTLTFALTPPSIFGIQYYRMMAYSSRNML